ncbi:ABC transporter substrate-binding protein [Carboxydochorda subterranea]|uniref:Probable sugar-binding periplasmic protein n=1 Tax=Carboxydichorda subterranea TaxID=3109565 RepID=A0ABZ1BXY6_9FIRM|nr:ABC transporter substrate-binding protein [Limnochorda sp. L945t]WRP17448.1 ABC transporter substrate-binding protein [Limnochorda sp. L945t]
MQTWSDPNNPSNQEAILVWAMKEWAKTRPDVQLELVPVPSRGFMATLNWYQRQLTAGQAADVIVWYAHVYADRADQWFYHFDLSKPNKYGKAASWFQEWPDPAAQLGTWKSAKGYYALPMTFPSIGNWAIVYNKTVFDKVGVNVPKTWTEFITVQRKLKEAGYTPFYHPAGGESGINFLGIPVTEYLPNEIAPVRADLERIQAYRAPSDQITAEDWAYAIKKGYRFSGHEGWKEVFRLLKEWSAYWQEGFLEPPISEDPVITHRAVMEYIYRDDVEVFAKNPAVDFEWGTFFMPAIDRQASRLGRNTTPYRGGGFSPVSTTIPFAVPLTTVKKGKLELALDMLQFVTTASMQANAMKHQLVPVPPYAGAPIEKVTSDPVKQTQWRGFFEPSGVGNQPIYVLPYGLSAQKATQEYLAGRISVEDVLRAMDEFAIQWAEDQIRRNPQWNASQW